MLAAEHRRPFAAFLLVCAAGFLITGFGLRTQVVQVLVDNGAPAALVGVVAPDVILGEMLRSKPAPPAEASPSASAQGPEIPDEPAASAATTITLDPPAAAHRAATPAAAHHRRVEAGTDAQSSATVAAVSTPVRTATATLALAPATTSGKPSAGKATPARAELQAPTTTQRAGAPTVQAPTLAAASTGRGHGEGHVRRDHGTRSVRVQHTSAPTPRRHDSAPHHAKSRDRSRHDKSRGSRHASDHGGHSRRGPEDRSGRH